GAFLGGLGFLAVGVFVIWFNAWWEGRVVVPDAGLDTQYAPKPSPRPARIPQDLCGIQPAIKFVGDAVQCWLTRRKKAYQSALGRGILCSGPGHTRATEGTHDRQPHDHVRRAPAEDRPRRGWCGLDG